jgi:hypothetical protein
MKLSITTVLVVLLTSAKLYAQHEIKIIPPSPESSSVFKFMETPISHYTGVPSTSIPLYEIKLKSVTIPINVSYHGRGIRVDELSSRVGLSWALSYGGLISRQIRDKADDRANGFLNQNYYNTVFTDNTLRSSMYQALLNQGIDMVPDQFFLDMNGVGIKFIFDQVTKEPLQQKFSDTRIVPITGQEGIEAWIIVDEQGNKFYYGKSKDGLRKSVDYDELINNFSFSRIGGMANLGNGNDDRSINSWHLMEIETPLNERVEFFYEEEIANIYRRSYDKIEGSNVVCFFSNVRSHQHQIKDIVYNNGKVSFSKLATEREDLTGTHVLEKVGIYNYHNQLLKEYVFQYNYTTSPNNNNQLAYLKGVDPKSSKRLFLKSIQEKSISGSTLPPYTFDYNPTLLPNRFSNSQDNWGFFNGKDNGEYLTFFKYGSHNVIRQVDEGKSEAGLLTKIKYPTGGSVQFTYEHNTAIPPPFFDQLLYPENNTTEIVPILDGFIKHSSYYANNIYSKQIIIGANKIGPVNFSVDLPHCPGPPQDDPSYCQYQIFLRGEGVDLYLYPPEKNRVLNLSPGTYTLEVQPPYDHDPDDFTNLFVVNLRWNAEVTTNTGPTNPTGNGFLMAAGKRIKKIEYKNEDGVVLTKEYSYANPSTGETSGKIFGLPNFYFIQKTVVVNGSPVTMVDPYGSLPGSPLTNLQGNNIGYSHVTEYFGDSNKNQGKIEYEFTTTEDGGDYYKFPYHLPIDNEWLRGKNTITKFHQRNSSGTYSLVKTIENSYLYAGLLSSPAPFMQPFLQEGSNFVYSKTRTNFYLPLLIFTSETNAYKVYYLTGGTCDLRSSKETHYEQDVAKLIKETNFRYNYASHYQVQGIENTASDGSKEISITSYPNDYPSGTSFIDGMKNNNILSYPIEEVKYKESGAVCSILSGKITTYTNDKPFVTKQVLTLHTENPVPLEVFKFSNRISGKLPPDGVPSAFSPYTGYKPLLTHDYFDVNGNVLQYKKTNDSPMSYVWDYKNQYPIAEVKNALYSDIAFTSFEADGKGNWSFSGTVLSDETSPTGKHVYNLATGEIIKQSLSTHQRYFLTYWVKSGTTPNISGSSGSSISSPSAVATFNGWTQFRSELTNTSSVKIDGNGIIDEVRLHPVSALMSTYTYDPIIGITSMSDENGKTTHFKYDQFNRLKYLKDNEKNIVKHYQYKYAKD